MDKKKIITNTIMFFITTAIVILFAALFGGENILVGVQGTAAVLFLLNTDYSLNPIRNTIYFVLLEVGIGVATYIASLNPYLALIITFLVIFYIFYTFSFNTKKPLFLPFFLAYIYMLYDPVTMVQLPKRIIGLVVCGLAIMLLQILANKNKLKRESISKLNSSLEAIDKQIKLSSSDSEEKLKLNKDTASKLNELIEYFTYAINQNQSKVTIYLVKYLSIAQFLDSLNIDLNRTNRFTDIKSLLNVLDSIKLYINNKVAIDDVLDTISSCKSKNLEIYPYILRLERELQETNADKIISNYSRNEFLRGFNLKNDIQRKSVRFTFAFRGALLMSIGVFLVALFNIENGKWIIFTLGAINQPYLDKATVKLRDRIIGTIGGVAIFLVVYSIVTGDSARMSLLLIVGYAMNYITKYTYSVVCITLFALGSISVGANIPYIAIQRLIFILIGSIIAIIADKLIFPTYAYKYTQIAINKSTANNEEIVNLLSQKDISVQVFNKKVKPLIIKNRWFNKYIAYNNIMLDSKDIDEYINNQNIFINDVISFNSLLYTTDNNINLEQVISNNFSSIENNLSNSNKLSNLAIESIQ